MIVLDENIIESLFGQDEVASFVIRFLRHPKFNTSAKRLGLVARVTRPGIHIWRVGSDVEEIAGW